MKEDNAEVYLLSIFFRISNSPFFWYLDMNRFSRIILIRSMLVLGRLLEYVVSKLLFMGFNHPMNSSFKRKSEVVYHNYALYNQL